MDGSWTGKNQVALLTVETWKPMGTKNSITAVLLAVWQGTTSRFLPYLSKSSFIYLSLGG